MRPLIKQVPLRCLPWQLGRKDPEAGIAKSTLWVGLKGHRYSAFLQGLLSESEWGRDCAKGPGPLPQGRTGWGGAQCRL